MTKASDGPKSTEFSIAYAPQAKQSVMPYACSVSATITHPTAALSNAEQERRSYQVPQGV